MLVVVLFALSFHIQSVITTVFSWVLFLSSVLSARGAFCLIKFKYHAQIYNAIPTKTTTLHLLKNNSSFLNYTPSMHTLHKLTSYLMISPALQIHESFAQTIVYLLLQYYSMQHLFPKTIYQGYQTMFVAQQLMYVLLQSHYQQLEILLDLMQCM